MAPTCTASTKSSLKNACNTEHISTPRGFRSRWRAYIKHRGLRVLHLFSDFFRASLLSTNNDERVSQWCVLATASWKRDIQLVLRRGIRRNTCNTHLRGGCYRCYVQKTKETLPNRLSLLLNMHPCVVPRRCSPFALSSRQVVSVGNQLGAGGATSVRQRNRVLASPTDLL